MLFSLTYQIYMTKVLYNQKNIDRMSISILNFIIGNVARTHKCSDSTSSKVNKLLCDEFQNFKFKIVIWHVCLTIWQMHHTFLNRHTVFPHIVSTETILFLLWPYVLWPLISVHKCAETIQGRKLFKGGNYMRKYGILFSAWYKKITWYMSQLK